MIAADESRQICGCQTAVGSVKSVCAVGKMPYIMNRSACVSSLGTRYRDSDILKVIIVLVRYCQSYCLCRWLPTERGSTMDLLLPQSNYRN